MTDALVIQALREIRRLTRRVADLERQNDVLTEKLDEVEDEIRTTLAAELATRDLCIEREFFTPEDFRRMNIQKVAWLDQFIAAHEAEAVDCN